MKTFGLGIICGMGVLLKMKYQGAFAATNQAKIHLFWKKFFTAATP